MIIRGSDVKNLQGGVYLRGFFQGNKIGVILGITDVYTSAAAYLQYTALS